MTIMAASLMLSCDGFMPENSQGGISADPVPVSSIASVGKYAAQGTIVAVTSKAFILADNTGAIMVYSDGHECSLMDVVKVYGVVYREGGYTSNVLRFEDPEIEKISSGAQWEYSPARLDAAGFDALVGKTPVCREIVFEGTLTIDRSYVNVQISGAQKKSSFKYAQTSDYSSLAGEVVVVKAFVVGSHNFLYIIPYSVTLKDGGSEDGGEDPGDNPGDDPLPSDPPAAVKSPWGVCGTHNSWGSTPDSEMVMENGLCVARNVTFPANESNNIFKLRRNNNWDQGELGATREKRMSPDTYCAVVSQDEYDIQIYPGTYDIWLDENASRVYVMTPGKDISQAVDVNDGSQVLNDMIASIQSEGEYTVQGTVVAIGSEAYVIADVTGALMIYGRDHGLSLMDVVKITGRAYRYNGSDYNVFQMKDVVPEIISTGSTWVYNTNVLLGVDLDDMVWKLANCVDVQISGTVETSGGKISISVEGANYQAVFTYVDNSKFGALGGQNVTVKAFVVGTYSKLQILPYDIVVEGGAGAADSDPRTKKWMELPDMKDFSLEYYYHKFDMNSKTYRNYSFGWDDSNKVAIWMAYPLSTLYTSGNAGRTEAWDRDPLLGADSPLPEGGYAGDYDKGHQVPSGDRQCSYEANAQTYYGTNMTAQGRDFNGGPWADLEGYIRNASRNSDTTYVVTGCYVADSREWETDSAGMPIKVPTAYFKAVLKLRGGNWTGGAYWTPHVGYSSSYLGWAISIDELEKKTGLDLYVNLPDKIGADAAAAIEAATSGSAKWWN